MQKNIHSNSPTEKILKFQAETLDQTSTAVLFNLTAIKKIIEAAGTHREFLTKFLAQSSPAFVFTNKRNVFEGVEYGREYASVDVKKTTELRQKLDSTHKAEKKWEDMVSKYNIQSMPSKLRGLVLSLFRQPIELDMVNCNIRLIYSLCTLLGYDMDKCHMVWKYIDERDQLKKYMLNNFDFNEFDFEKFKVKGDTEDEKKKSWSKQCWIRPLTSRRNCTLHDNRIKDPKLQSMYRQYTRQLWGMRTFLLQQDSIPTLPVGQNGGYFLRLGEGSKKDNQEGSAISHLLESVEFHIMKKGMGIAQEMGCTLVQTIFDGGIIDNVPLHSEEKLCTRALQFGWGQSDH